MSEKILIVDDDLDTLRLVGLMLQKQGFQIVAASTGAQGLELALSELPDLIILDVMMPGMDGYQVARRLRSNEKTLDIPILMFTAKSQLDDKVSGFEAGADDYLTKPTHPTELQAHVKALLARSTKAKVTTNPSSKPLEDTAHTIGIIAARGGLGVTTVAVNLAGALWQRSEKNVIMAEFRPGQATLGYDLGFDKTTALTELLNTPPREITRSMIDEKLIKRPEGIKVLAASTRPKDTVLIQNVPQFEAILGRLEYMARYVVVDLGSGISPLTQKLLPSFKEIIVVVEPFENSLRQSKELIDDLAEMGVNKEHLYVLANYRLRSDTPQLSVTQMQLLLPVPIDGSLTPAPELYQQATRRHLIASVMIMDSLTGQQFATLAGKIETRSSKPAQV
jgi:pilus assembly protein CpaE